MEELASVTRLPLTFVVGILSHHNMLAKSSSREKAVVSKERLVFNKQSCSL